MRFAHLHGPYPDLCVVRGVLRRDWSDHARPRMRLRDLFAGVHGFATCRSAYIGFTRYFEKRIRAASCVPSPDCKTVHGMPRARLTHSIGPSAGPPRTGQMAFRITDRPNLAPHHATARRDAANDLTVHSRSSSDLVLVILARSFEAPAFPRIKLMACPFMFANLILYCLA